MREAFIAKKKADLKVENPVKPELNSPAEVNDEIELTEISDETINNECKTRLITMRSKPDYVEFVLL